MFVENFGCLLSDRSAVCVTNYFLRRPGIGQAIYVLLSGLSQGASRANVVKEHSRHPISVFFVDHFRVAANYFNHLYRVTAFIGHEYCHRSMLPNHSFRRLPDSCYPYEQ